MEDQKIVELFFARSEDALTEVSVKYGGLIKKIAMNVLNNAADAEECANDTYMALWENIPPERPQSMIGYVCRLARNISVNRYRYNTADKRNSSYEVALEEVDHADVSHEKGTAVVTLKADISNEQLKKAVEDQDYSVTGIRD